MPIPLVTSQPAVKTSSSSAPEVAPAPKTPFASRLSATPKTEAKQQAAGASDAALTADAEAQELSALHDRIKKFQEQIELMQRTMLAAGPGPTPTLERE